MDRYLKRLDKELAKFKSELEADNEGITEILEQIAMVEEVRTLRVLSWRAGYDSAFLSC